MTKKSWFFEDERGVIKDIFVNFSVQHAMGLI